MSADPDDEALTWAGEETEPVAPSVVMVEQGAEHRTEHPPVPALLIVTYGVLAGLYLIATLGWGIAMQRNTVTQPDPLGEFMFTFGELLALASPALWFGTVLLLTRGRRPLTRLLLLLVGLAVVIPWPFVLLGV